MPAPGCIPAKALLETASVHRSVAGAKSFGIDATNSLDLSVTQDRKQKVVDQLFKGLGGLPAPEGHDLRRSRRSTPTAPSP